MKRRQLLYGVLMSVVVGMCVPMGAMAQDDAKEIDIKALSRKLDTMFRSKTTRAKMRMEIVTPNYERTLTMEMLTRGQDDALIRIQSPRKEKGISTLKKGNEMWNYLPKVKKVIRVPPSMMTSSWMGSDMTNDDLVQNSSWEDDYDVSQLKDVPTGEFCLQFTPHEDAPVTWSKVVACFDARYQLPKTQSFYDEKGTKVREIKMDKYKKVDDRLIPSRITITPLSKDKKGNKTTMIYESIAFDVDIDEAEFSLANLRRGK